MGWTMVCPTCQTQVDEHGYCTDCGCPDCGKAVDSIPEEWIDREGRLLMEARDLVVEIDERFRTFEQAPRVRIAFEQALPGLTVHVDGTPARILSGSLAFGGLDPVERTAQAIEAQGRFDALDRLVREPETMDMDQVAAAEHELRRAINALVAFRNLGFDADDLPGGDETHPLVRDIAEYLDRAFDQLDGAMRSLETPEDYDIEDTL